MRPVHAVLLLVAFVALTALAWFLIESDDLDASTAAPLSESQVAEVEPPASAEALADPGTEVEGDRVPERSALDPAPAGQEPATAEAPAGPERLLTGRIVDALVNPVPGAFVYVAATGVTGVDLGTLLGEDADHVRRSEETEDDGRFAVLLPGGTEMRVAVRAGGFAPLTRRVTVAADVGHDLGDLTLETSVLLAGRVVDSSDLPVESVQISNLLSGGIPEEGGIVLGADSAPGEVVATTDALGRFSIDRLASGPWRLLTSAEGYPPAVSEGRTARPGESVSDLVIELSDAASIAGRVTGAPAPAELTVVARYVEGPGGTTRESLGAAAAADRRTAVVGEDGSFAISGLRRGALYRLMLTDDPDSVFPPSRATSVTVPAGELDVELAYRTRSALTFQVVDRSTARPVESFVTRAGAMLLAPLAGEDGRARTRHPEGRVRYELDADGFGGRVQLEVSALGYEVYARDSIEVPPGEDLDLGVIALTPVPLVTVSVLDLATGAPVEGARVRLAASGDEDLRAMARRMAPSGGPDSEFDDASTAQTPASGRVELSSLPGRAATVRVEHPDYAPYLSAELHLPTAGELEHEVRLSPGGVVTVTAVDADGAPLAGIAIEHRRPTESADMPPVFDEERTDSEGRLVFRRLEPGEHRFRIHEGGSGMFLSDEGGRRINVRMVRRDGGGRAERPYETVLVADGGEHEVRIVGQPRGRLVGRVTEAGAPLAGAVLELIDAAEAGSALGGFGNQHPTARTDGEGRYAFEEVDAGEYELRVKHAHRAMAANYDLEVVAGENDHDVHLSRASLEGRVTDESGEPLEGVRMTARVHQEEGGGAVQRRMMFIGSTGGGGAMMTTAEDDGGAEDVFTDAEGRYVLSGVASDVDLVVEAQLSGRQPGRSEPVSVGPDQTRTGVDVGLELGGAIEVAVTRADGSPGRMCLVNAQRLDAEGQTMGAPKVSMTDDAGRAAFDGLEPGPWRVQVTIIDFGSGAGPGASEPDHVEEVEVEVGGTRSVEASVP